MFIRASAGGYGFSGHTAAVEDGRAWTVRYDIRVDRHWRTSTADVWLWNENGSSRRSLRHDGVGRWTVDGAYVTELDGCMDVDLESSACTNTFPIHRLAPHGGRHHAPAAYLRVDGGVERLEQNYQRAGGGEGGPAYDYEAPRFEFSARLEYDWHGLVLRYPGIAERVR